MDSIHQSTLNTALRCGEQFRRRYIDNEIIPPGIAAARGTGVHKANEVNLKYKLQNKEDMPLSSLKDVARDGYVHALRNGVYISKSDLPSKSKLLNDGLNDTLVCTSVYHEKVAPLINPVAIEQEFNIDVGLKFPMGGRMDYQEAPTVGDLKTSSKSWQKDRIKQEIQVPFYSFAHERERGIRPEFRYDVLISRRGKNGDMTSSDYQPLTHTCSDSDYRGLFAKMKLFIDMYTAGIFPPANPTSWWCGPNWCGYWYTCEYVGNSKQSNWI